jgi:tetratricopeptide (TPR) repeat protein
VAGGFGESAETLAEAVRLDPGNAEAFACLGAAQRQLGKDEQAAASLRQALRLDPKCAPAMLHLASLLSDDKNRRLGSRDEASELAGKACALISADDVVNLLALSGVCEQTGRIADALSAAQQAMRLAQEAGNAPLITAVQQRLARLARRTL